jgi:chemotaxis response regulator CheB
MNEKRIKVLVVDDSALVRQILVEILRRARDIEVVGTASDPFMAREKIKETNPDVLTLDVEMPRMDGLTFLANLMRLRPMPVVMISSLTDRGAETTLKALELGAVDFVSKPKIDIAGTLGDFGEEILAKIRAAAGARVISRGHHTPVAVVPKHSGRRWQAPVADHGSHHRHRRIHGRYRGHPRRADGAAGGLSGHRHRATHSGGVQRAVHAAHEHGRRHVGV